MTGFNTGLEGILYISRENFDNTEKISGMLYIVQETNGFSLYLGNMKLLAECFIRLTQADYAKLENPDENTLYVIT